MGIFDRLATLIKSNLNDLISSAENPEKMLNQIIVDMRDQLMKAKQEVASAIADEKRLRDQADGEYKLAQEWMGRAELAVSLNAPDDARRSAIMPVNQRFAMAALKEALAAALPPSGQAQVS